MRKALPLFLILLTYLSLGVLYARQTPAWQSPDEPAHYNYVRQLADGRLPVMAPGDYDEQYRHELVSSRFSPEYDITVLTYEDWQPPLYYLLQLPVFRLTAGSLLFMRLISVLMGAGMVALAYAIARLLLPQQEWVAWSTAVLVAFTPQHLSMMASANNDALAELLIAAILLLLLKWTQRPQAVRLLWWLGLMLGLGFLTKGTVYLMAPVIAVALLWQSWGRWRALAQNGLRVFIPALGLGVLWWGRNIAVYGGLDILGKSRHDAVVVGQIRTAEWISQYGLAGTAQRFWQTTFNSYWGQFGWMAVPMPQWIYWLLLAMVITAVAGIFLAPYIWPAAPNAPQGWLRRLPISNLQFTILALLTMLTLALHIGYNLTFVQHQGRYLFPALIPLALGMSIGLGAWALLLAQAIRQPRLPFWLPIGLGLAFVVLDLAALYRFIIPNLA
jgi:4-amino-4-deoxy-L-arabinose transferase-like glycosyltransferase